MHSFNSGIGCIHLGGGGEAKDTGNRRSAFPGSVQICNIQSTLQAEMSTPAPTTAPAPASPPTKSAPPPAPRAAPPKASVSSPPPSTTPVASSPPPSRTPVASAPPPSRTPPASSPPLSSPPSSTPSSSPPTAETPPSAASPPSSSTPSSPASPHSSSPPPPASGKPSSSPPHHARPSPPPPHRSSHSSPSSSDEGLSTPLIIVIAAAGALAVLAIVVLIACCRKKKKRHPPPQYYGDSPYPYKEDYQGGRVQHWQQNAPPPMDHLVKIPPLPHPPPAANAVRQPSSPPAYLPPPPPPPPPLLGGMSSEEYSSSGFSGSRRVLLAPPSPGLSLGFSKGMFTYEDLEAATNGFSQANLLGQGGFGYVYKGTLPGGQLVAVKRLKVGGGQGEREFQAEVEIISRVHHRHLVSLVGYCIAGSQRILVYEFVSNNTLEYHLHAKGRPSMDWPTRLKIALGAARGLAYLHEDCYPRIIHRDIKSSNILLDDNFEAKVADFGLAKPASDGFTHVSTRVMGTFGYLAPEYASSGKLTEKSDVFSFGVMLLELITGRRPVDATATYLEDSLVEWARPLLGQALEDGSMDSLVDPRLHNSYDMNEMMRVIASAAACVRHSARRRPRMGQIVRALEGDVSLSALNDGMKPGHSTVYGTHESSDYDSSQYSEDMKKFRKMALGSQEYGSEYSGPTSEYGLNPSVSSSEFQHSKDMEISTGRLYLPRQTGNRKNHAGMTSEYLSSKERKTPPDLSSKFVNQ